MTDLIADIGWLEFQSKYLSVCQFSIHSGVYSVVGVWSALSGQDGNASFIVWTLYGELYVVIHPPGLFSYADYIIHIPLQLWCGEYNRLSTVQSFTSMYIVVLGSGLSAGMAPNNCFIIEDSLCLILFS